MTSPAQAAPSAPAVEIRHRRRPVVPYVLLIPAVVALLVGLGYPVYWQVVTSMQEYGLLQQFGAPPTFVGLDNYARIFTDERLWAVVLRSIAFCLVNAFLTVAIGMGLALLMRAVHGAVRIIIQVALLLAWATPMVAAVTVFRWLFDYRTGVVNYLLESVGITPPHDGAWLSSPLTFFVVASLVVIWMSVPFVAMSVYAGLTQVSEEVLEAARLDGARPAQILRHILLPLVRPVLAIVLLLQIIWDLRVFAQIRLLQDAGAPVSETNLLGNFIYELGIGSQDFAGAAAVSIFVLLLTVLLSAPYVRSLMKEDAA
ncbi:carbohydrate ABC transporter permease [Isoptericola dokdonensis]|jgi:N,N'-diacetylchitobiose transport system permease protein|uniref:Maltose transport system permease protein MalF n=1 Tax=Isoptericola dokdonensis DS-3 TaxID=1300344 RepID=A0A168F2U2_9MICO|nr:sugar ABC transporter permease [Isoptericola dokdonensis]ANC30821.1 Maltose transport system permease protein MalF [Isoptericola dokdonensis DS-3]